MRFAWRLVLGIVMVVLVAVVALVWLSERGLREDLRADAAHALEREARVVAAALPADSLAWGRAIRGLAGEDERITLVDRTGRVVVESDAGAGRRPAESQADRPEILRALAGEVGVDARRNEAAGEDFLYVAIPGGPGAIRVATGLALVDGTVRRAQRSVLLAALLALLVGTLAAVLAARSFARPLTAIAGAAHAIAAGTPPRFPRSGIQEVDALVQALRRMHRELDERFAALRRERQESSALVEAMVEGVVAADHRGQVVTANAAARVLLGYEPGEPLPVLTQLFRTKAARDVVREVLGGAVIHGREMRLNGCALIMSARPLPDGGAVLVLHNVSELRRLEAVRKDFVANVSHELKTPLTSISGYAETLLSDAPDPDTARLFLETIHANATRMQRLVDDLLDLARIESGHWQPTVETIRLAPAIEDAWTPLAGPAATRGVAFAVEVAAGAETLRADPDGVRQILTNLFENALRHTGAGGRITCHAVPAGGGVELRVVDTGTGIPREHLPRVFERFYRADPSRSRAAGGTGLGLSIVRHLMEGHSGRARIESELGEGTTVTCWFPEDPETES